MRYGQTPEQVMASLARLAELGLVRIYRPDERRRALCVSDTVPLPAMPRGRRRPVTPRW